MRVTAQYAKEHFDELLTANEGDEIDIEREDQRTVRLTLVPKTAVADRNRLLGAMKGQIWMSDDFSSPEMGEEMADLFEGVDCGIEKPLA
jgi:hypothetical protein